MKRLLLTVLLALICTPLWSASDTVVHTDPIPTLAKHAQHATTHPNGDIDLNFNKAPLIEVVHLMSIYLHRTFLIDPKLNGTLTVVSGKPVPRSAAYALFARALQSQGFVLVEEKGYTAILAAADAKTAATYPTRQHQPQMTSKLVMLSQLEAHTVADLLRTMMPTYSVILPYPANNSILLTDTLAHMHDMIALIAQLDHDRAAITIVPLHYAVLPDIEPFVNKLADNNTAHTTETHFLSVRILPDEANNRFFLMGGNAHMHQVIQQEIHTLDLAHAHTHTDFHVLYLQHSSASKMAQILGNLLATGANNKSNTTAAPVAAHATAQAYQQNTNQTVTNALAHGNLAGTAAGNASTALGMTNSAPIDIHANANEQATTVVIPGAVIEADPDINALVIRTSDAYYKHLLPMIRQLDVRRAQIFIEALIVEVNSTHMKDLGIQWQALAGLGKNSFTPFAGSVYPGQNGLFNVMKNPGNAGPGLVAGLVNGTINIPGLGPVANIGLLGQFLASSNLANILSTPNLLTLDNQEAEIIVGQNVPFVTGQYTNTNGNTAPFQTIERHDVGLRLHIAPHIMANGNIRLSLYQEVSSVMPNTDSKSVDIITNKRAMQTTVRIHDGEIIALGGLIEDRLQNQVDKIPILGDLPFFGALFRHHHQERIKTNLMIFLRPRIIYDRDDLSHLSIDRYHLIHTLKGNDEQEDKDNRHFDQVISPETLGWALKPLQFPAADPSKEPQCAVFGQLTAPAKSDTDTAMQYTSLNH